MSLSGKFYRVGAMPPGFLPWHDVCAFGNLTNCTLPGIDAEMLLSLSQLLNFTFNVEVLSPPENLSIANPTWEDYFTYYLSNDFIDFTMNSLSMTINLQNRGVQFAAPLIYTDRGFMVKTPERDLRFLLTQPFEKEVWWCLFGSTAVLAFLCALVWTPSKADGKLEENGCFMSWIQHLARSIWTIGMITLQQSLPPSYYLHRRPYTQKLLIAFWIVGSFVLTASYSAMLISVLLDVNTQRGLFKNVHQLARLIENNGYRTIIAEDERYMFNAWITILDKRPLYKDYVSAIRKYPPMVAPSFEEILNRIMKDRYLVYPCRLTEVQYRIKEARCNVTFIESWEENIPTSPGFARNFPDLEAFTRAMLTLSSAVFEEIKERYIPPPICDPVPSDMSLSTHQLQGGFWLMAGGALCALLVFATEAFVKQVRSLCAHEIDPTPGPTILPDQNQNDKMKNGNVEKKEN